VLPVTRMTLSASRMEMGVSGDSRGKNEGRC
jgi:hypothetical protein